MADKWLCLRLPPRVEASSFRPIRLQDRLKADDVVIWVPVEHANDAVGNVEGIDPRFGWVGFIVAKIAPEIDMTTSELKIISHYD
ncbi:MAG: hypothetical protein HOC63_12330 [Rhodospirillales bacterium]|jgi:hypothetical protein|nr:hypothetical protein [Rhodospirillales bacterium]MBT4041834.1 hypothetical protein [Rhodospirillales bacterium]MBT4627465.1 hypothetical protein [Rhodospirillales bacterium]MBT5351629.1 hypothetical protein [Rhodospirillales bacterium]MBT5521189.1 hypothetical protein [Rhodospirillales bacterium]